MFTRILTGIDFGPGGRDAVALAVDLAAPAGQVTLAAVVMSDPRVLGPRDGERAAERAQAEQLLEREVRLLAVRRRGGAEAMVREPELRTEVIVAASVARGLCWAADRLGADLLVVGMPRAGRVARALWGDATQRILRCAPCPVAVAPVGYAEHGVACRIGVGG